MYLQIVTVKSAMDEGELMRIANERSAEFRKLPGLKQKYYVKTGEPGVYQGVYLWESMEAMQAFRETDLAATIPKAYQMTAPPEVTVSEVMFQLRE